MKSLQASIRKTGVPLAVVVCVLCATGATGYRHGARAFKSENIQGAIYSTAMFHDQHAMAVALGAYPRNKYPTEADIRRQLRRLLRTYRKYRTGSLSKNTSNESFGAIIENLDNLLRQDDTAEWAEFPAFVHPTLRIYGEATKEAALAFLTKCRLWQQLVEAMNSKFPMRFSESDDSTMVPHTELVRLVLSTISNRCEGFSCFASESWLGSAPCLDIACHVETKVSDTTTCISAAHGIDFSGVRPIFVEIGHGDNTPRSVLEQLQNQNLLSFSPGDTNFVIKIPLVRENERF